MKDKDGIGVTVISHDNESRTYVPSQNRLRDIHYTGASLSQLASLTSVSSHCEQYIKYECHDSGLYLLTPTSWWVSRDSARITYWGGASPGSGKCACGMTNSCADSFTTQTPGLAVTVIRMTIHGMKTAVCSLTRQLFQ